jgi:hypothetical protein
MMPAPVELVPKKARQNETVQSSLIETAEELLADVKAGAIKAIVIVTQDKDGQFHHRASYNFNLREEIGGLFGIMMQRVFQATGGLEDE